jgi:hypothetical protein
MMIDTIATLAERNPEDLKSLDQLKTALRSTTGDPATDPFFELDPSTRRTMVDQVEREYIRRQSENDRKTKEFQREHEHTVSMKIINGELTGPRAIATLEQMQYEGKISPGKQEQLTRDLVAKQERDQRAREHAADRAERKAEKRAAELQPAIDAEKYEVQGDPRDAKYVKAVNLRWEETVRNDPKADPIEFSKRYNVVPKPYLAAVRMRVMSDDPKRAAQGAMELATLQSVVPNVQHQVSTEVANKGIMLVNGMDNAQAQANVQRARNLTPAQQQAYKDDAKPELDKADRELAKAFPNVRVTNAAVGKYRELYPAQLIAYGGDKEAAREATLLHVRKNFGITNLTGKNELMLNPPGGVGGTPEWVSGDYKETLKSVNLKPEDTQPPEWNAREGGYRVLLKNGKPVIDPETKQPAIWYPDSEAHAKKLNDAEMAKAKKAREEELKPPSKDAVYLNELKNKVVSAVTPSSNVTSADMANFKPRGAKTSSTVNTTEPKFGKF